MCQGSKTSLHCATQRRGCEGGAQGLIMDSMDANGARLRLVVALVCVAGLITGAGAASVYRSLHTSSPVNFRMSTIDDNAGLGTSGLTGEDIDGDGILDLVSFGNSGTTAGPVPGEIYWYQYTGSESKGPSWTRRLITKKPTPVHGDFIDVDGDGYRDLVFFSDFNMPIQNASTEGNIWWAKRPLELEQAEEWEAFWIGRSLGAHRIVTVPDLDGSGAQWGAVVVPLANPGQFPTYGPAPITLYFPNSSDPTLPWTKFVSSQQFLDTHNAILAPPHYSATPTVLLAAAEGIVELTFRQQESGGGWELDFVSAHPPPTDAEGDDAFRDTGFSVLGQANPAFNISGVTSLDVSPPPAGKGEGLFLAAIDYTVTSGYLANEPWHGDSVSVYETTSDGSLQRKVLEKRDGGGHHVQIDDFNGDGYLDVAAGFRAYPSSLVLYLGVPDGNSTSGYERQIISERAAEQLVVHDWNRDGRPDIAACGDGKLLAQLAATRPQRFFFTGAKQGDPYILLWTNEGTGRSSPPPVYRPTLAQVAVASHFDKAETASK